MKMKKFIGGMCAMLLALAVPTESNAQKKDWGVGVRLGDPSGITVKKYMKGSALEFSVGRTHWWYGRGWYNNHFNTWYYKQNYPYSDVSYIGYSHAAPVSMQLHYMLQRGISRIADENVSGLDWYLGGGVQFAYQRYAYSYRYKVEGNPNWIYVTDERVSDYDLGVDGVVGIEYTFPKVPVSVFLDVNLFMEVIDDPFVFWGQGGTGVRYNF